MENEKKLIDVWILKYFATDGIFPAKAEMCEGRGITPNNLIRVMDSGSFNSYALYHGKGREWTDSYEDAVKVVSKKIEKKITSLKRQIESLTQLQIDIHHSLQTTKNKQ